MTCILLLHLANILVVVRFLPNNTVVVFVRASCKYVYLYARTVVLCTQFSLVPLPTGSSGGAWGAIQQRSCSSVSCRRPLWAVLAWARMSSLWCCPFSFVAHPPGCPEGWFWRGCHDVWHARTIQVSAPLQLPEEVPEGRLYCLYWKQGTAYVLLFPGDRILQIQKLRPPLLGTESC